VMASLNRPGVLHEYYTDGRGAASIQHAVGA